MSLSPNYQPAPKDAGFYLVQASLLLTREEIIHWIISLILDV